MGAPVFTSLLSPNADTRYKNKKWSTLNAFSVLEILTLVKAVNSLTVFPQTRSKELARYNPSRVQSGVSQNCQSRIQLHQG